MKFFCYLYCLMMEFSFYSLSIFIRYVFIFEFINLSELKSQEITIRVSGISVTLYGWKGDIYCYLNNF